MTAVAAPTYRTALSEGIRMSLITAQAEKQFQQLSASDRLRVAEDLGKAVCGNRCRLVSNLRKLRVYHFDSTYTLRVSYRLLDGRACVLHIGSHTEFRQFATCYTGTLPNSPIPIEESTVMIKYQTNGHSAAKVEPSATASVAPTEAKPEENVAENLARLLLASRAFEERAKSIDDTIVRFMEDARDSAVEKVEGELEHVEGRLSGHRAALEELRGVVAGLRDELSAVNEGVAVHHGEVDARLEAQRAGLSAVGARLGELVEKCDGDLAAIAIAVRNVEEESGDFARKIEARLEAFSAALASRVDRIAADEEQLVRRLDELDTRLEELVAKYERDLTAIATAVRNVEQGSGDFARNIEARLGAITAALAEDRTATIASRVDRIAADEEQLVRRLDEQDARLDATDHILASGQEEVAGLHASLHDLVAREGRERQERERRTFRARWLVVLGAIRSAFAGTRSRRSTPST